MTRSVEIPEAAVEAAEAAMRGHDCHEVVNANISHLARAAVEAALPYLAPAGDGGLREALEQLRGDWSLEEIVKEAIREAEWCCEVGCGSGACETCPCCCAGYCVSGRDGLPNDDPEAVGFWLEIASQHNPAIAALRPLLLAAHPAAPAVPQPVDRKRFADVLREFGHEEDGGGGWVLFADDLDDFRAALVKAGVFQEPTPQPVDREALEQRIRRVYIDGGAHVTHAQEAATEIVDAILPLLGSEVKP